MDERFLDVFVREVERQSTFGLSAARDLALALSTPDMDRVWYSTQALLVAAGNVSKLLWPARKASGGRGMELRELLGVKDESPLKPRVFRNHFEHYDERLEDWMASSERHNIVDSSVLPMSAVAGIDRGDFLRNLDPTNMSLTFRGDSYELAPLVAALRELKNRATARVNTPPWQRAASNNPDGSETLRAPYPAELAAHDLVEIAMSRCRAQTRREAHRAARSVVFEIPPGPRGIDKKARTQHANKIAAEILERWAAGKP